MAYRKKTSRKKTTFPLLIAAAALGSVLGAAPAQAGPPPGHVGGPGIHCHWRHVSGHWIWVNGHRVWVPPRTVRICH